MNELLCRKCGARLVGMTPRLEELKLEKKRIVSKLASIPKIEHYKARTKELHIRLEEINRILSFEKKLIHLEGRRQEDNVLVELLKEFVTKEQFAEAVKKRDIVIANYKAEERRYKKLIHDTDILYSPRNNSTANKAIGKTL